MSVGQILEIAGVIFTLLNVYLLTRQKILAWPFGLLGVSIYAYIFYSAQLYSDFILHLIYIVLNAYGWWYWASGHYEKEDDLQVTSLFPKEKVIWIVTIVLGFLLWGYLMQRHTDAALPYPDAFTTVTSLVAQYLLARKKIENWILWIIVDIVAIIIYVIKDLYPTSILFAILLILSISGFLTWKKSIEKPDN